MLQFWPFLALTWGTISQELSVESGQNTRVVTHLQHGQGRLEHEAGGGQLVWTGGEVWMQVRGDGQLSEVRNFLLICFRSTDGSEQITFGELYKINERISSRFACILKSAQKFR